MATATEMTKEQALAKLREASDMVDQAAAILRDVWGRSSGALATPEALTAFGEKIDKDIAWVDERWDTDHDA